jgi:hypothetical protein
MSEEIVVAQDPQERQLAGERFDINQFLLIFPVEDRQMVHDIMFEMALSGNFENFLNRFKKGRERVRALYFLVQERKREQAKPEKRKREDEEQKAQKLQALPSIAQEERERREEERERREEEEMKVEGPVPAPPPSFVQLDPSQMEMLLNMTRFRQAPPPQGPPKAIEQEAQSIPQAEKDEEKKGFAEEKEGFAEEKEGFAEEKEGVGEEKEGVAEEKEGVAEEKDVPKANPDAMHVESEGGEPVNVRQDTEAEGDVDPRGVPPQFEGPEDDAGPGTGDFGADGRDDFLSPDELKTLHQDRFTWRQDNTKYLTRESRGKLGYGTTTDVQRIEPFGVGVKRHPDQDDDILIKQAEAGFEPFRGRHALEKVTAQQKEKEMMKAPEQDIEPVANKPFAKIGGRIIWIPFYGKTAKYFFKAKDYEELVGHVIENQGELKLKAPDQKAFQHMQKTIDEVRASLASYGLMQRRIRHESLVTRHAEWLELKQIMKAIGDYQETTTGEYNTAGLFSGNLRDAITKALNDTIGNMDSKSVGRMRRGLDAVQEGVQAQASDDLQIGEMHSMNPFMVEDMNLQQVDETLPRFF